MENYFTSKRFLPLLALVFCGFSGLSFADDLPWASSAEEVGMSTEQLNRINDVIQGHIDAGTIQGAVTAVARRGKIVHLETHGLMNVTDDKPMQEDALFIMMSSTKPILGVAAMMLIEQGLIQPSDPVSKWIPEFAEMQAASVAKPARSRNILRRPLRALLPVHKRKRLRWRRAAAPTHRRRLVLVAAARPLPQRAARGLARGPLDPLLLLLLLLLPPAPATTRCFLGTAGRQAHHVAVADLAELAEVHDRDAVADVLDHRQVVTDEEEAQAVTRLHVLEHVEDLGLHRDVES